MDLKSSDGRIEIQLAPDTFNLSHATVVVSKTSGTSKAKQPVTSSKTTSASSTITPFTGALTLTFSEQHGYFVGENVSLGSYQFQFTDSQNRPVSGLALRQPITILYHYQESVMRQFDLDPGHIFLSWPLVSQAAQKAHQAPTASTVILSNNSKTHTLSAKTSFFGPGPFTLSGDPVNQVPPSPLVGSVQGNAGQLSYTYPISVPVGPNGFGPSLSINYSSETVNERHSYNQPAGDLGDGWSFSLGSISADVHAANSDGGGLTWYNMSGVDGISDRLVPNPKNQSQFLTQHLTYLKIQMTNNCFQVWDTSGTYYEFGCTSDSLQYHKDSDGTIHYYRWDLDKVVAPNEGNTATEKTITISYLQDCAPTYANPCPTASNASNGEAIRDASPKQIVVKAGSTVVSTTDMLYQAPNAASPWANAYGTNYNKYSGYTCSPPISTTLRCDDPLSYSGGVPAPSVMSTLSLQKITSYVGSDSSGQSAFEYDFSYQDSAFSSKNPVSGYQCTDPTTNPGVPEYCAGEHLLTKITPVVYQGGTGHTLKPALFHYYPFTNTYSDHSSPNPMPNGGLYSISTGWQYMDYYYDSDSGVGAHVFYKRAYGNTHGTPYDPGTGSGTVGYVDNRYDPTYCTTHAGDSNSQLDCNTSGSAFNYPDDRAWTNQVVTQITTVGSDSSTLPEATTTYTYQLENINGTCPKDSQNDTACVSDIWSPPTDGAWQDFYDSEYRGMAGVLTTNPSGNLTANYYIVTDGPDSYSSYSRNYNSGNLVQEDVYQGNSTTSPLLQETAQIYTGYSGTTNSCNGNYSGVYTPCEAIMISKTTATCEGVSGCSATATNPTWPEVTTNYTYDDYTTSGGLGDYNSAGSYHNLQQEQITSNDAPTVTNIWHYQPENQTIGSTVYYDVNKVVESEVDDSSGHRWQCETTAYDEGNTAGTTAGNPVAGWPTTVKEYDNNNCTYPTMGTPMITTYTGYDAYGNTVATVDGVATANSSLYGSSGTSPDNGCTLTTNPVIMSSNWGKTNYTSCSVYDSDYARLLSTTNAFGQTISTQFDTTQAGGLPVKVTDQNNQITSTAYTYTTNSRTVQEKQPGESGSYTTQSSTNSSCPTSIPGGTETPCYQISSNSSLYSNAISQKFYDAVGREVESSTPIAAIDGGSSGTYYYSVVLTVYRDDTTHSMWQSVPFVVVGSSSGVGWLDPNASTTKDYKGNPPTGSATYLDALDRTIATKDPMFGSQGVPGIPCTPLGSNATTCAVYGIGTVSGDANVYATVTSTDPNNHVAESFSDALGRTRYA